MQKYCKLRCFLSVKGLVICFYLGWSGSILHFRQSIIKVGSKSCLATCSSNMTLSLPSYNGSALKRELTTVSTTNFTSKALGIRAIIELNIMKCKWNPPKSQRPKIGNRWMKKRKNREEEKNIRSRVVTRCISDFQLRVPHWPCWMSGNLAGGVGKWKVRISTPFSSY